MTTEIHIGLIALLVLGLVLQAVALWRSRQKISAVRTEMEEEHFNFSAIQEAYSNCRAQLDALEITAHDLAAENAHLKHRIAGYQGAVSRLRKERSEQ